MDALGYLMLDSLIRHALYEPANALCQRIRKFHDARKKEVPHPQCRRILTSSDSRFHDWTLPVTELQQGTPSYATIQFDSHSYLAS